MKLPLAMLIACLLGLSSVASAAATAPFKGTVLETKDAGQYTYLRLKANDGEVWAAVVKSPVKVGSSVTIQDPLLMTQFESKALHRTFDKIIFGTLAGGPPAEGGSPAQGYMSAHTVADRQVNVPVGKIARAQGAGGRTVAEVFAQKSQLTDKRVLVRGKVVKFSAEIMGSNWVHLRDGTGSAADGTDDLLVTTKEKAAVGDVVQAEGLVRTNADFGAGYSYKVMIEGATLRK